jgi:hypothetical protein
MIIADCDDTGRTRGKYTRPVGVPARPVALLVLTHALQAVPESVILIKHYPAMSACPQRLRVNGPETD